MKENKKSNNLPVKPLIYAVDDEHDILELIRVNLSNSGFRLETFDRALPLFDKLEEQIPDLVVLDIMLPDMDGIEVCRRLKSDDKYKHLPIIMLTAKSGETDIVLGLELGADDYMVKPFSPRELSARIKSILRRTSASESPKGEGDIIKVGEQISIDLNRHDVWVNGEKVKLTKTEFIILQTLSSKPGWVFSREKLLTKLWGDDKFVIDRTIDVHIKNLRDKLKSAGSAIINVRGVGYKLEL